MQVKNTRITFESSDEELCDEASKASGTNDSVARRKAHENEVTASACRTVATRSDRLSALRNPSSNSESEGFVEEGDDFPGPKVQFGASEAENATSESVCTVHSDIAHVETESMCGSDSDSHIDSSSESSSEDDDDDAPLLLAGNSTIKAKKAAPLSVKHTAKAKLDTASVPDTPQNTELSEVKRLCATATFEDIRLSPWLVQSCRALGLRRPTPVQYSVIPAILEGRDCIACAQLDRERLHLLHCLY